MPNPLKFILYFLLFLDLATASAQTQNWKPAMSGILESYQWLGSGRPTGFEIKFKPNGPLGKDWIYGHWLDKDSVVRCMAYREGGKWVPLPFHLTDPNNYSNTGDIVQYGDTMYMGGYFDGIVLDKDSSTIPFCTTLKFYNDSLWRSPVIMDLITDFAASGDSLLVVAGMYQGPVDTLGVFMLSPDKGATWQFPFSVLPPSSGAFSDPHIQIAIKDGDIYTLNDGAVGPYTGLVRWDGQQWHGYGNGIYGTYSTVYDFEFYKNEIYMVGSFNKNEDSRNPGQFIAKWNGTGWEEVGGGLNSGAFDLFVSNGVLYCQILGNQFGDANISALAGWDGHKWCGTPINYTVGVTSNLNFAIIKDTLYASFKDHSGTANGQPLSYLNYFDGDYLHGPNAVCSTPGLGEEEVKVQQDQLKIFPNPTAGKVTVFLPERKKIHVLKVYDVNGRGVLQKDLQGSSTIELDVSGLAKGIYVLEINGTYRQKLVRE